MNFVTGREHVAGIEADAEAFRILHAVEYRGNLLELRTEARALPRGEFEQHLNLEPGRAGANFIESRDDLGDARIDTAAGVRAGMRHEVAQAECLGPLDFIHEGGNRLPIKSIVG